MFSKELWVNKPWAEIHFKVWKVIQVGKVYTMAWHYTAVFVQWLATTLDFIICQSLFLIPSVQHRITSAWTKVTVLPISTFVRLNIYHHCCRIFTSLIFALIDLHSAVAYLNSFVQWVIFCSELFLPLSYFLQWVIFSSVVASLSYFLQRGGVKTLTCDFRST